MTPIIMTTIPGRRSRIAVSQSRIAHGRHRPVVKVSESSEVPCATLVFFPLSLSGLFVVLISVLLPAQSGRVPVGNPLNDEVKRDGNIATKEALVCRSLENNTPGKTNYQIKNDSKVEEL